MLTRMLTALALGLLITAAGCQDPVMAPYAGQVDLLPAQEYPQIAVDKGLAKFLAFDRPNVQGGPDKPLSVAVPTRLLYDGNVNVQYKFIFLDRSGRPLKPAMDPRYLLLTPRVQVMLSGAALDTNAVDWRLEVTSAK
jgi:uncharacterized protein YcfL